MDFKSLTPNHELRSKARASLSGKWKMAALVGLIFMITALVSLFFMWPCILFMNPLFIDIPGVILVLFLPYILIMPVLMYGYYIVSLDIVRLGTKPKIGDLFCGFKTYGAVLGTILLQMLYVMLWALLFYIPGVIKLYSYAMTPYIIKDFPELGANATIEKSMEMMRGNKMKLFLLHLSFIGWYFLCMFTFAIGCLWLMPYMMSSQAAFYEDLKNKE